MHEERSSLSLELDDVGRMLSSFESFRSDTSKASSHQSTCDCILNAIYLLLPSTERVLIDGLPEETEESTRVQSHPRTRVFDHFTISCAMGLAGFLSILTDVMR